MVPRFAALAALLLILSSSVEAQQFQYAGTDIESGIARHRRTRLITALHPQMHSVQVDRAKWNALSYSEKESFCRMIAAYCGLKSQETSLGSDWVEVHDGAGKRLAKYGSWGYQADD